MLRALEVNATALREKYAPSAKDDEFLRDLKNGEFDVLISHNTKQRTNPLERRLLKESGVTSLYIGPFWGSLGFWAQATWLVKHWPTIEGFVKGVAKGACADIYQNGRARPYNLQ